MGAHKTKQVIWAADLLKKSKKKSCKKVFPWESRATQKNPYVFVEEGNQGQYLKKRRSCGFSKLSCQRNWPKGSIDMKTTQW